MTQLTHLDAQGQAMMVDVSAKAETVRYAVAQGSIRMNATAFEAIVAGKVKKGDVLAVARVAGIMAAKHTSAMIPLCHPLMLSQARIEFTLDEQEHTIEAEATTKITGKTGVEMEALCAVSTALLTIYDMAKALDRTMVIGDICLLEKAGGKSGHFQREVAS